MSSREQARQERRDRVLEAASEALDSASYEWAKAITFDFLATESGIARRQIERDFGSRQQLVEELVEFCLSAGNLEDPDEQMADFQQLLANKDVDLREAIIEMGKARLLTTTDNPQLLIQMGLWGLATTDAASYDALRQFYERLDFDTQSLYHRLFEPLETLGVSRRPGLTMEEFALAATAVTEGLAIRAKLDPSFIGDDLGGRFLAAITSAWLETDGAGSPIAEELVAIDERRRGDKPSA